MSEIDYSKIPTPSRQCVVCGRDLAHVAKHPSVLEVSEHGEAQRRDVCEECWEKVTDRDFFSFWLTHREVPKPDTRQARERHRAALLRLFEEMLTADDERFRVHLYVLAHTLMKQRLLKWEGTERSEDGVERIVFRNPATDEQVRVEEIDLSDERLVAVMREIDTAAMPPADREQESSGHPNDPREANESPQQA